MAGRFARVVVGAAVLAVLWLAGPPAVLADDTNLGRAVDGVYPVEAPDIEMVQENVTIELFDPSDPSDLPGICSRARCEFLFRNTSSEAREVRMGFPAERVADPEARGDFRVRDFRAYAGGEELPVSLEPASAGAPGAPGAPGVPGVPGAAEGYSSWYTFTVRFGPNQEQTVVNTYWVANSSSSNGDTWAVYVLRTGRFWADRIGRATVRVVLGGVHLGQLANLYPNNWRVEPDGRGLVWRREDFEPTHDLILRYNVRDGSEAFLRDLAPEFREPILARRAELEDLVRRAPGLDPRELLKIYDQAVAAGDPIKATVARSFIPADLLPERPPALGRIEVTPGGDKSWKMVRVPYSDPDGDLAGLLVRVSHEERGKKVVDWEDGDDQEERWRFAAEYSGTFERGLSVTPGVTYLIEVTLTDGAGHEATARQRYVAPGGVAVWRAVEWAVLLLVALLVAAGAILFARRKRARLGA